MTIGDDFTLSHHTITPPPSTHTHTHTHSHTHQVMLMKDHPHENIVQFYNSYLVEDELWVVMEYLDGGALTSIVQQTR